MEDQHFTTTILLDKTPQQVYEAVNNVSTWWHGEIEGPTTQLEDEFSYRMKEFHFSKQRIITMIPFKKVEWLVTESALNFTEKPDEWTGTTISFEITEVGDKTQLQFSHLGLNPTCECFGACSNGWTMLIHESLTNLLNAGQGKPVFD